MLNIDLSQAQAVGIRQDVHIGDVEKVIIYHSFDNPEE